MDAIHNFLREIGCQELIEVFEDNKIDEQSVYLLQDDELKELFPKIGPRLKFKKFIQELKADLPISFVDDFILQSAEVPPSTPKKVQEESASTKKIPVQLPESATENEPVQTLVSSKNKSASLDGRAILREGQVGGGLLKESARRKLSQLLIHTILEQNPLKTITTEEFYRLATDVCELFVKESVVVYYSAYVSSTSSTGKKNASGKLYESYISRRRKLREAGDLPGTSRRSSKSTSSNTNSTVSADNYQDKEEDSYEEYEYLIWLKNNVDPWQTVQEYWTQTTEYRLKEISKGDGKIEDYFRDFPALKLPQGYTLLLQDFRHMHPGKDNNLSSKITIEKERIIQQARSKVQTTRDKYTKTEIADLLDLINDADPETSTNVAIILLAFLINISPGRKVKNKPIWKPSRAEVKSGFIAQAANEAEVTTHIISKREKLSKIARTLQPFIIYVGESIVNTKVIYVVINDTLYNFQKLITAVDCAFKIYQATGAYYPEEAQDIWTVIQIGFYGIKTKYDRCTQAVNTLLTDLELLT